MYRGLQKTARAQGKIHTQPQRLGQVAFVVAVVSVFCLAMGSLGGREPCFWFLVPGVQRH